MNELVGARGRLATGASVVASAGLIACSTTGERSHPELPAAVSGERRETRGRAGRLSYYVAGAGAPLLLIHSINASGSAYEVRPIHERMLARRRVYSVDLPGFGFSDRSPRSYEVRVYVDAVHDMLDVIGADTGTGPVDTLALSLSSEFLAKAAVERPERFRSLALVTPTGFQRGADKLRGPDGATREVPGLYRFFTFPLWSSGFYRLLTSRRSIRYFLQRTWGSKEIDEGLVDYDLITTRQPGAMHAPFFFVSGRLFSKDIRTVYERLSVPVWVPHGTKGDFRDFSEAAWTEQRPNWSLEPYDAGALPQFERPDELVASYERFLDSAGAYPSTSPVRSPSP